MTAQRFCSPVHAPSAGRNRSFKPAYGAVLMGSQKRCVVPPNVMRHAARQTGALRKERK